MISLKANLMLSIYFIVFCSFLLAQPIWAFDEIDPEEASFNPEPGSVRILDVSYSGPGCPQGTVVNDISPDNEVVTLLFSQFQVYKAAEDKTPLIKSFCKSRFVMDSPSGWTHAVASIHVQGFADLQPGLTGFQNLAYSYSDGRGRNPLGKMKIVGPFADDYVRSEQTPTNELVWSPCDHKSNNITLLSTIGIESSPNASAKGIGLMTMEVLENILDYGEPNQLAQQMALIWKRCPSAQNPKPSKASYLALCPVHVRNKTTGETLRTFTVKSRARSTDLALKKAELKATRRCLNQPHSRRPKRFNNRAWQNSAPGRRFETETFDGPNLSCTLQRELCQTVEL